MTYQERVERDPAWRAALDAALAEGWLDPGPYRSCLADLDAALRDIAPGLASWKDAHPVEVALLKSIPPSVGGSPVGLHHTSPGGETSTIVLGLCGIELQEAAETLIHECMHAVHYQNLARVDALVRAAFARCTTPIAPIAAKNHSEYLAESGLAFFIEPETLVRVDPNAAAMVREVLALVGIE